MALAFDLETIGVSQNHLMLTIWEKAKINNLNSRLSHTITTERFRGNKYVQHCNVQTAKYGRVKLPEISDVWGEVAPDLDFSKFPVEFCCTTLFPVAVAQCCILRKSRLVDKS
jgi:hypothetical protein